MSDTEKIVTQEEMLEFSKEKKKAKKENDLVLKKFKKKKTIEKTNLLAYLFLMPWLIGFFAFTLFPFCFTVYSSLFEVERTALGLKYTFAGPDNYIQALLRNLEFLPNLITFIMNEAIFVPTILVISFILALLLNQEIKGRGVFRVVFFLPVVIISGPVMEKIIWNGAGTVFPYENNMIFRIIFNYSPWFSVQLARLFDNFLFVLWFTGIPIILFINGLQKINRQLYEAAKIDGANAWQSLWKITIPIIKSTALIIVIFSIVNIGSYRIINPTLWQIDATIGQSKGLGFSSAMAVIYTLVVAFFVGISFLLLGREKKVKQVKLSSLQEENLRKVYMKRLKKEEGGNK